jgi:hypothetical protein
MAYRVWVQEEPLGEDSPPTGSSVSAPEQIPPNRRTFLKESAYRVIAERSLFSPDRKESLPEEPKAKTEKAQPIISGKKIHLYGVIIMGDERKALIDNPVRGRDEPNKKWVRVGDAFSDLRVAAIEPKSILLEQGKDNYEISLYDDERKNPQPSPNRKAPSFSTPTVVNTETKEPSSSAKPESDSDTKPRVKPKPVIREQDDATGEFETFETPFGTFQRKKRSN